MSEAGAAKAAAGRFRIATVYQHARYGVFQPCEMSTVRWLRMSEALARAGFQVDLVLDADRCRRSTLPNLRFVPFAEAEWDRYDVIKTLFHRGFESLVRHGVADHPFIISKLGSAVGPTDDVPGVYFHGEVRERLWRTQRAILDQSRWVVLLTARSQQLWDKCYGPRGNVLRVPTGIDRDLPAPRRNPYAGLDGRIVVYIGTIYRQRQLATNLYWQERLNRIGRRLRRRGIRLCFVGPGFTHLLDDDAVTCFGPVPYAEIWDYQYGAEAGLVLAQGPIQDNESSKLYNYLRSGLPPVSEAPVPNNNLIDKAGLGFVAPFEDDDAIADLVEQAIDRDWDREPAIRHMLDHHTWDHRAAVYRDLILQELDASPAAKKQRAGG